ncbi:DUF6988 family protein [Vibrio sp. E14]|uniref:DUF6988 family protein n=1 Tax=Vibrio sp. E14 TaxID=2849869 RepID=UPI001CF7F3E9|nr:hypothetical protein [Vibrio sp. E14]
MEEFQGIIRQCDVLTREVEFDRNTRNIVAMALFDLSHEHAMSISHLCDIQRYGSAASLYRSCAEAYIRGSWVYHCASDSEVLATKNRNKKGKALSTLVDELTDKHQDFSFLNRYAKSSLKNVLDSLSHGQSIQIAHRFDGESIGFIYDAEVVKVFLQEACMFSLLSNASIAQISRDSSMEASIEKLFERMHECV